jgi:hypothetical protein
MAENTVTWSWDYQLSYFYESSFFSMELVDCLTFSESVDNSSSNEVDTTILSRSSSMERRNRKIYLKRGYIPLDGLWLLNLLNIDSVESWVGNFKEMQKWLTFEIVFSLDSERILMKNPICT